MIKLRHIIFAGALSLIVAAACAGNENKNGVLDASATASSIPALPQKMDFAGEQVPLNYFDTRESLERELLINTFWHSQTLFNIKQASRYFPVIEPILKKEGVPDDLKYLAIAESSLQNVVSPAKAAGPWQFLESTAKVFGLEVSPDVDERYNIEKSTEAAAKYIKRAKNQFGNWTLAAASYNIGTVGLQRHITRQKQKSYYNLMLGEETGRYVFRILAFKLIIANPSNYGFNLTKADLHPPLEYTEVKVDSAISNLADFAIAHKTNYKMLKLYNPWLRTNTLPKKPGKSYTIKIPKEGFRENAYKQ